MNDKFHVERKCKQCGKIFIVPTYRLKWGRGKYCSRKCDGLFHRGNNIIVPVFSEEDADLREKAWQVFKSKRQIYAHISIRDKFPPHTNRIYPAHRVVLSRMIGRPLSRKEYCDHINFDTLDCRRENLRLVNASQNSQHRKPLAEKHRNAYFVRKSKKWRSHCVIRGITYNCGIWPTIKLAMEAAEKKREELHAI